MRILQLIATTQRRGAELFAGALSDALRKRGHEVAVWAVSAKGKGGAGGELEVDRVLRPTGKVRWRIQDSAGLARAARAFAPDLMQASGGSTTTVAAVAAWLDPGRCWQLVYRNIGDPLVWFSSPWRRLFYRAVVWPNIDGVVSGSNLARAGLEGLFGSRLPPCRVVFRGVVEDHLQPTRSREHVREELGAQSDHVVLVWVGALSPEKRPDRALKVLRRCVLSEAPTVLWMVGDGPLGRETECLADELGIADRVRWIGVVDDVGTYLHAADVFLQTSDTEGVPGALLEAMTVGLPSVVTRVGGIPEVVEESMTGFLVPPDDEDALGERLVRLSADPDLRRQLGENAARAAQGLFGMRRCAAEHEEFYQWLRKVPKC